MTRASILVAGISLLAACARPDAPGDHEGMAEALALVLATGRDAYTATFAGAAEAFAWPRVTAPLVRMVTATELPPRLGEGALVPALPGPVSRALLTRALHGAARKLAWIRR